MLDKLNGAQKAMLYSFRCVRYFDQVICLDWFNRMTEVCPRELDPAKCMMDVVTNLNLAIQKEDQKFMQDNKVAIGFVAASAAVLTCYGLYKASRHALNYVSDTCTRQANGHRLR